MIGHDWAKQTWDSAVEAALDAAVDGFDSPSGMVAAAFPVIVAGIVEALRGYDDNYAGVAFHQLADVADLIEREFTPALTNKESQ